MKCIPMLLLLSGTLSPPTRVAWIEIRLWLCVAFRISSPPTRVAWIEIKNETQCDDLIERSPPTRVAWIEIDKARSSVGLSIVATHAGGVD